MQKHFLSNKSNCNEIILCKRVTGDFFALNTQAQTINQPDSLEIISKINDWNKGWKVRNYLLAIKWYAGDAEFTNAFGQHLVGQPGIESLLNEVFQLSFVMAGDSKVVSQKMMLIAPDVALVITVIAKGKPANT